ncbi:hypothetical protein LCGC14_0879710 [marine sediment metagenome]|uniref:FHA domain-containing protein n=1 Tax=marine sediment metagenome TaxID=412755 RepID=A0A0F9RLT6_9ZZZZ|nr:FHA domain-containing protein [Actinomycetota bacterium]
MINLVLFSLKFVFLGLLYLFIFLLVRSIMNDTKLAAADVIDEPKPAKLVLNFGDKNSKTFNLTDKVIIGRSEGADIQLEDSFASSSHAKLQKQGATYVVQDLKSTNGTLLNGNKIKKETLNSGDEIKIGKNKFKFLQ